MGFLSLNFFGQDVGVRLAAQAVEGTVCFAQGQVEPPDEGVFTVVGLHFFGGDRLIVGQIGLGEESVGLGDESGDEIGALLFVQVGDEVYDDQMQVIVTGQHVLQEEVAHDRDEEAGGAAQE